MSTPPPPQPGEPTPPQEGSSEGQAGWVPPSQVPPASTGVLIALMFAGLAIYSVLNVVIGVLVVVGMGSDDANATPYLIAGTVVLALIGLGAGIGLLFVRRPWTKGIGLGLMIGWALWSIVSAGYCTGLNPGLYG
ncbi:hypothetical protein [Nonomuraea sp. CA-141351]|uniref:hypothetical protein n=1 Tax=Nonomuraea sp. CA-141351 TaxID=3239996 RepID=UPI003D8AB0F2